MTSRTDDAPARIGGRYLLQERIGAGAMGAVWRGTDELLNREVAVKELLAAAMPPTPAGGSALEESRQRILREGRIGARLQHAHVISMFDVVVHDDRPWLVMEYLPSRSLAAVLGERGSLDAREVAEIGRQVADGLAAAHAAGVVHRDVKPGNVLIGDGGLVKITDFGVSRAVDDVQLTRTGLIAGTPAFLAPEVARGQEPTAASDVFALGSTLYAAVEGRPPFGLDDNAYAVLHKVATSEVRPPVQAGPLTALIMRLLSADPAERPSAAAARDTLAAIAGGRHAAVPAPAATGPDSPPPRRSAPATRSVPVLLGVLTAVLLAGGVTAAVLAGGAAPSPVQQAAPPPTTLPEQVPRSVAASEPPSPSPLPSSPASSPAPEPSPRPQQAPTTPPSSSLQASPAPEPTTEAAGPSAVDPVSFVQGYYALLPGNLDAAWPMLTPAAQRQSGGRGGFDAFYARMESVTLEDARAVGEDTVEATVVFVERDGSTSREPYRFVLTAGDDGRVLMQSFSRL